MCWDARRGGEAVAAYPRPVSTHQRVGFDVDPTGRFLATGSDGDEALVYDLSTGGLAKTVPGHGGAVNGVAFHPRGLPLLALSTGTRIVTPPYEDEEEGSGGDEGKNVWQLGGRKRICCGNGKQKCRVSIANLPLIAWPAVADGAPEGTVEGAGSHERRPVGESSMEESSMGEVYAADAVGEGGEGGEDDGEEGDDDDVNDEEEEEEEREGEKGEAAPEQQALAASAGVESRASGAISVQKASDAILLRASAFPAAAEKPPLEEALDMEVAELRSELSKRGELTTGLKRILIARLRRCEKREQKEGGWTKTVALPGGRKLSVGHLRGGGVRLGESGAEGAMSFSAEQWQLITQAVPLLASPLGQLDVE